MPEKSIRWINLNGCLDLAVYLGLSSYVLLYKRATELARVELYLCIITSLLRRWESYDEPIGKVCHLGVHFLRMEIVRAHISVMCVV